MLASIDISLRAFIKRAEEMHERAEKSYQQVKVLHLGRNILLILEQCDNLISMKVGKPIDVHLICQLISCSKLIAVLNKRALPQIKRGLSQFSRSSRNSCR